MSLRCSWPRIALHLLVVAIACGCGQATNAGGGGFAFDVAMVKDAGLADADGGVKTDLGVADAATDALDGGVGDGVADVVADLISDVGLDSQQDDVVDIAPAGCVPANCDDKNPCTVDTCTANYVCQHVPKLDGDTCDDGNVCTTAELCSAGVCVGVGPVCGNATCDCGENAVSCPADCAPPMALIPAGSFWIGCNAAKDAKCQPSEQPQHKVTLSAYYMDLTETTVTQYKACVDAAVCTLPGKQVPIWYATYPDFPNHPVTFIDWAQARQYCQWRGATFDLPTEAQWEMAARGDCEKNGSTADDPGCAAAMRTYPWGEDQPTCSNAVLNGALKQGCDTNFTWEVGSKPAGVSPYGLHDLEGNVSEWTRDWSGNYGAAAVTDPLGPSSATYRSIRGSSLSSPANKSFGRACERSYDYPNGAGGSIGLRCVRAIP